jgi:hypothetical protein
VMGYKSSQRMKESFAWQIFDDLKMYRTNCCTREEGSPSLDLLVATILQEKRTKQIYACRGKPGWKDL